MDIKVGNYFKPNHELIYSMKKNTYQIIVESFIVVVFVFIHPNFSQSNGVFLDNIDPCSPFVGTPFSKDMSHMGARNDF